MGSKRNYLIGQAENLTYKTPYRGGFSDGGDLYTFPENLSRIKAPLQNTMDSLGNLDASLCPRGFAVSSFTLHPSYISKSAFPNKLLRNFGLQSIGSRPTHVKPDRWTKKGEPVTSPSTTLYVAGKKESFSNLCQSLNSQLIPSEYNADLCAIWTIGVFESEDKIKQADNEEVSHFEVGIQCIPNMSSDFIKHSFANFATDLGFETKFDYSIEVGNLWFIPITGSASQLAKLAGFSFVRVIRPIAKIRAFTPLVRSQHFDISASLPTEPPIAHDVRVAILDGGLPSEHSLGPWIHRYSLSDPKYGDCDGGVEHGLGVTSAYLFGPLEAGKPAARPYTYVDHYRVLDQGSSDENPYELYRTLAHIEDILVSRQYDFINLSLGPELTVDDDDIHPWTSLIDSYLSDGQTFLTVAAGNNGAANKEFKLNRIQVPSDCVNAVTVGASSTEEENWERAYYSAVGPGRAPGRIKPDFTVFGGGPVQYFHVATPGSTFKLTPQLGTSFASPYLLRSAAGIKAIFGHNLSGLAIRALMINGATSNGLDTAEVGWGTIPKDISKLVESPEGTARIVYQGTLEPKKVLRLPIPMPENKIQGMVDITATCCISSNTDPQDTSMYTKAGVRVSWFPKKGKSESFFGQNKKATEADLRSDAGKWETNLSETKTKNGKLLDRPCFEVHYLAREGGADISEHKADVVSYAFVITLKAKKHLTLHDDILNAHSDVLNHIEPRVIAEVEIEA